MKELTKLRSFPTLGEVLRGDFWQQHQLKIGKGPYSSSRDVAKSLEDCIKKSWILASLGDNLLSSRRIQEKIVSAVERLKKLKNQPKSRFKSPSYSKKLKSFESECEKLFDICSRKCVFPFDIIS